jgi:hypothetical protein
MVTMPEKSATKKQRVDSSLLLLRYSLNQINHPLSSRHKHCSTVMTQLFTKLVRYKFNF